MEDFQKQIDELRSELGMINSKLTESKAPSIPPYQPIKNYETLQVDKLYANLPVYVASRTDTPKHGEIYVSTIGGVRQLEIYIKDTLNQAWTATLS